MKSILLIEGDSNILENMAEFLAMEGFSILSANSATQGIELAGKFIPDLIICDTPKPGIDGYEVLRLLVNSADNYEIPFIFCTTLCENFYRLEALELGADEYIVKPFELDKVMEQARDCLKYGSRRQRSIR